MFESTQPRGLRPVLRFLLLAVLVLVSGTAAVAQPLIAAAHADPQMAADMLVRAALNAGGRDNITVIVVDMRSDMPCDEDWNVSKIGDDEDIDDALDGTLQTLRVIQ